MSLVSYHQDGKFAGNTPLDANVGQVWALVAQTDPSDGVGNATRHELGSQTAAAARAHSSARQEATQRLAAGRHETEVTERHAGSLPSHWRPRWEAGRRPWWKHTFTLFTTGMQRVLACRWAGRRRMQGKRYGREPVARRNRIQSCPGFNALDVALRPARPARLATPDTTSRPQRAGPSARAGARELRSGRRFPRTGV